MGLPECWEARRRMQWMKILAKAVPMSTTFRAAS